MTRSIEEMYEFLTKGDVECYDDNLNNRFENPYWVVTSNNLRTAGYPTAEEAINMHLDALESAAKGLKVGCGKCGRIHPKESRCSDFISNEKTDKCPGCGSTNVRLNMDYHRPDLPPRWCNHLWHGDGPRG